MNSLFRCQPSALAACAALLAMHAGHAMAAELPGNIWLGTKERREGGRKTRNAPVKSRSLRPGEGPRKSHKQLKKPSTEVRPSAGDAAARMFKTQALVGAKSRDKALQHKKGSNAQVPSTEMRRSSAAACGRSCARRQPRVRSRNGPHSGAN